MHAKFKKITALVIGGTALVAGAVSATAATSAQSDARAVYAAGNVTQCSEIGLPASAGWLQVSGDVETPSSTSADGVLQFSVTPAGSTTPVDPALLGGGKWTATSDLVNVTPVPGTIIGAIVVKGGPGYQIYSSPAHNMISPLNKGKNVPQLSHWFACYQPGSSMEF
jgi:hypothetical protein